MCCGEALFIIAQCFIVQIYYLLACAKGVVGGAISGPVQCVCFTAVAIALLPHDIAVTYYTAAKTKALGPWLKTLVMLLLPVPLLTWPVWAALAGLLSGFCTSLAILVSARAHHMFKDDGDGGSHRGRGAFPGVLDWLALPITGWGTACRQTGHNIVSFADFNYNSYFSYLSEVRNHPGPPFDISPVRLLASLGVALVGGVMGLIAAVAQLPKFPVVLIKIWYEIVKAYFNLRHCTECVLCLIPFLLALALTPVGLVLVTGLLVVGCLACGFMWAGIKGYQAPTMADMAWHGVAHVWNMFHALEDGIDDFIGFKCLPIFTHKLPLPGYDAKRKEHTAYPPHDEAKVDLEAPSPAPSASASHPASAGADGDANNTAKVKCYTAGIGDDDPEQPPVAPGGVAVVGDGAVQPAAGPASGPASVGSAPEEASKEAHGAQRNGVAKDCSLNEASACPQAARGGGDVEAPPATVTRHSAAAPEQLPVAAVAGPSDDVEAPVGGQRAAAVQNQQEHTSGGDAAIPVALPAITVVVQSASEQQQLGQQQPR